MARDAPSRELPPADWVTDLIRKFQDQLTSGLYEAIYQLDPPNVQKLMHAQAHTCSGAFLDLGLLPRTLSLDEFLRRMAIAGPSKIDIARDGNTIRWTEQHHQGQCACPFVKREVIRLDPKLCICGAQWVKLLFKRVADTDVDVEIGDTVATGAPNCCFRITIKGSSSIAATPSSTACPGTKQA